MAKITDVLWQLQKATEFDGSKLKENLDKEYDWFNSFAEQIVDAIMQLKDEWTITEDVARELLQKVSELKDNYESETTSQDVEVPKEASNEQPQELQPQEPQPQEPVVNEQPQWDWLEQQLSDEQSQFEKLSQQVNGMQ